MDPLTPCQMLSAVNRRDYSRLYACRGFSFPIIQHDLETPEGKRKEERRMRTGCDVCRRMEMKRQREESAGSKRQGWLKIHVSPFGGGENFPAERRERERV